MRGFVVMGGLMAAALLYDPVAAGFVAAGSAIYVGAWFRELFRSDT